MNNTLIILFGSTGDLARKKILPALFELYKKKQLINTPILCVGRRQITKDQFIEHADLIKLKEHSQDAYSIFISNLFYQTANLDEEHPASLHSQILKLDKEYQCNGNKIVYLATSSDLFIPTIDLMNRTHTLNDKSIFAFEKPFAHDLKSAKKLEKDILKRVKKTNLYLIDHYLGKPLVHSIPQIPNLDEIKKPIKKHNIERIRIELVEDGGIENRGEYYDKSGAIRDMIQSHALQILSLLLAGTQNSNKKANIIKKLKAPRAKDIILGQYQNYLNESNINKNSKTETFVLFKTSIKVKNKKIQISIKTGKALEKKSSDIYIELKNKSIVHIRIGPNPSVSINNSPIPIDIDKSDGYEHIFLGLMNQDRSRFVSLPEIQASWKFIDKLIKNAKKTKLKIYAQGSEGPKEAEKLLNLKIIHLCAGVGRT